MGYPPGASRQGGRGRQQAFSRAEVVLALMVLGFVALMVCPKVFARHPYAGVTQALLQMNGLRTALDAFHADMGYYPPGTNGLLDLVKKPVGATEWHGPYVDALIDDPWGHAYTYNYPSHDASSGRIYDLTSLGEPGANTPTVTGSPGKAGVRIHAFGGTDDFRRIRLVDGVPQSEGYTSREGRHFPGAESGGARALYDPGRHCGLALVSADGWRVPYGGSDCVVYHEGLGHTLGLPHPEPMNDSIMGTAQYVFALNETWLNRDQKQRMGWEAPGKPADLSRDLFTRFSAKYQPAAPVVGQEVRVNFTWPTNAQLDRLSVALQTNLFGSWRELPTAVTPTPPASMSLGVFTDSTPVSYRVRVSLQDSQNTEIWGYFQVRDPARRTFWYDYPFDRPGKRLWSRGPDGQWSETYPDGRETVFREAGPETVEGVNGVVARRQPGDGFEVWIPNAGKSERWLRCRTEPASAWAGLGAIHEVELGVPPTPHQ